MGRAARTWKEEEESAARNIQRNELVFGESSIFYKRNGKKAKNENRLKSRSKKSLMIIIINKKPDFSVIQHFILLTDNNVTVKYLCKFRAVCQILYCT